MGFGSFFKHAFNVVSHVVENAVHNPIATISDVVAVATGQPEIAALGNAAQTSLNGGSLKDSIISGATSYATSAIGNAAGEYASTSGIGRSLGLDTEVGSIVNGSESVGPQFINPGIGDIVGQETSNAIGARVAATTVGSLISGAGALALTSSAKSGSDVSTVTPSTSNASTTTNTATGATVAPSIGDTAVQQSGDDVARAAAEARGRTASILSDQSDDDVTQGNPNVLKRKSLLSD